MKEYEKYEKIVKQQRLKKLTCDLCGAEGVGEGWKSSEWNVNETKMKVTVTQTEGLSYPEGGTGTEYVIDLCPECFKNRLVPWLTSQGAEIEKMEWDW